MNNKNKKQSSSFMTTTTDNNNNNNFDLNSNTNAFISNKRKKLKDPNEPQK